MRSPRPRAGSPGTIPAFLLLTGQWSGNENWYGVALAIFVVVVFGGLYLFAPQLRQAEPSVRPRLGRHVAVEGAVEPAARPVPPVLTSAQRSHQAAKDTSMPEVVFPLDSTKKFTDQKYVGHNRWHPDIPANVMVKPGDMFRVHCREWFDGAIVNDDSADDVLNAPLSTVHVLSGPIGVEGAEPGDLLIVDILDVGPIPQEDSGPLSGQGWGYTGVFATRNGGGFLTEQFPDAYKVIWDFRGRSGHVTPHPARLVHRHRAPRPDGHRALARPAGQVERPRGGADRHRSRTGCHRWRCRRCPRTPSSASSPGTHFTKAAAEAARTAPPRENGGNQDIKNFTKGTRVFYPVFVHGANLSMGDLHFSQGDGEITFCGAIEMGGFMDLHVDLIKGGMATYGVSENAIFMPGNIDPQFSQWLAFSGTSVTLGRRAALPRLAPVVPAGLPARHRLPADVRLQRHPGLHDPGRRADRRPAVRRGGHPELVLHGVHPHGHLRLRRRSVEGRSDEDRSRHGCSKVRRLVTFTR